MKKSGKHIKTRVKWGEELIKEMGETLDNHIVKLVKVQTAKACDPLH